VSETPTAIASEASIDMDGEHCGNSRGLTIFSALG
jgi:hypothetical protein